MPATATRPATIRVDRIVGMAEIAERLGASTQAVWNWSQREDFPAPAGRVSNRPFWDWDKVEKWNKGWKRSKGGFHTHKAQKG